jgi:hypothetical protein
MTMFVIVVRIRRKIFLLMMMVDGETEIVMHDELVYNNNGRFLHDEDEMMGMMMMIKMKMDGAFKKIFFGYQKK